jgi:hypothetical protein
MTDMWARRSGGDRTGVVAPFCKILDDDYGSRTCAMYHVQNSISPNRITNSRHLVSVEGLRLPPGAAFQGSHGVHDIHIGFCLDISHLCWSHDR